MLGEVNHDKIVEFAQSGFSKATDLANAGLDIGAQGIQYAASGISAGADAFEHGVSEGLGALSNGIDTALHSTSAEIISGGLATARESAAQLGDAISTLAVDGYHAVSAAVSDTVDGVTVAVTDGVHQARESIAGGLHGLAGQIEPDTHAYAAAAGVDEAPVAPEAPEAAVVVPAAPEVVTVTVSKGDSLWKIAETQFEANGIDPTNAQIQAAAKDLYEANRDVIGTDPNRIFPGQALKIDPALFGAEPAVHVAEVAPVAPSGIHTQVAGLASGGELKTSSWASALSNLARDKHQVDLSPAL
ncbi:LysM peptidoglycan-binding domain-containing protein [Pseudomonas syringae pv. actinidiae]|nr:LysM peptidoglycan-binding domain-containing protein [Pseudomonas syringae pv. actinidiae]RJX56389.1 LysM peptidoglycan-binding domain-containing protein [Pseudomonas syringae pv. actinidiae]RJX60639.1 LysM peptidoglycan-binding domain-containing protein [Pseudomonas syringae pv. actinidiae]RJY21588.1 LysM peptidoglycan-binding domain-containing protein [Pseudomonas syringae pv. actinidiae]